MDMNLVLGEAAFLLMLGWRQTDQPRIHEGMRVARQSWQERDWRFWADMPLSAVIEEFWHLGAA